MLPVLSYLNNLQTGERSYNSYFPKVNLDDQLLRLVNYSEDTLPTFHRYPDGPPFVCKFRRDNELDLLAVANENGEIMIVDTEKSKVLRSFFAHKNAVFDICWLPDKNFLMTASGDFTAKLYDMTTCECVSTYPGHTGSIKTIDVCHLDNNIFATGTRDGSIGIWDRRERHSIIKRPCSVITDAHIRYNPYRLKIDYIKQNLSSISSVTFQDSNHLVSAGVADGHLKVWDLRRTYLKNRQYTPWRIMEYCTDKTKGIGCTSLKFDSTHTKLYAYFTSNEVHRFDCLSYSNDGVAYTGMMSKTYYVGMDLSHDDQYILGGSKDGKAYIWNTNKPGPPIVALPCTKIEVGAVAWCPYSITKLVTASDDCRLRIWRIHTSNEEDESYESKATTEGCKEPHSTPLLESLKATFAKRPVSFHRHSYPKTPVSKPITNYYSPVTPSTPVHPISPSSSSSPDSAPSPKTDQAVRSPCKTVTDNELVSSVPSGHSATSPQKGKENHSSAAVDATSTVQVKRKLCLNKVSCKYHPEGCGRTKGRTRCGKRIAFYPPPEDQPSIKNFFTTP